MCVCVSTILYMCMLAFFEKPAPPTLPQFCSDLLNLSRFTQVILHLTCAFFSFFFFLANNQFSRYCDFFFYYLLFILLIFKTFWKAYPSYNFSQSVSNLPGVLGHGPPLDSSFFFFFFSFFAFDQFFEFRYIFHIKWSSYGCLVSCKKKKKKKRTVVIRP